MGQDTHPLVLCSYVSLIEQGVQARTKGGEHNLPIFQPGAQGARSISQKHSLRKDQTGFELISGLGHREAVHQDNRIGFFGLVEEKSDLSV